MRLKKTTVLGPDEDHHLGSARLSINDKRAVIKYTQAISVDPEGWPIVGSKHTDEGIKVVYSGEVVDVEQAGSMAGMRVKLHCVPPQKHGNLSATP